MAKLIGQGDEINGFPPLIEAYYALVYPLVFFAVECIRPEKRGHFEDRIAVDQQGAKKGLLCVNIAGG
jgi:hypothetical protein